MAASTIDVDAGKLMSALTLRIRFTRLANARLRVGVWLMKMAAWVAGCGVEIDHDQRLEFTPDGIPRALSTLGTCKGYCSDAPTYGAGLVIYLDGVEQTDVAAYDIDTGRVSCAVRHDGSLRDSVVGNDGVGGVMIEHRRGVVTVERREG